VSWQLSSYVIVALALAACFWWYERSRPPATEVAVVATMAAFAALGRDALAAVPDVKPITAIVLVSGVAFGAGPGFAVGAIGALASNILLGQGPWTPWQMLGWGAVGVGGALLGAATGRRLGRLSLALACAFAAEGFNLILDLFTWTSTGAHTLAGYGFVLGSAAVFDVTHVVASFAFGLLFGPALLRMLLRVRLRLEITWRPLGSTSGLLVAVCVIGAGAGGALLGLGSTSARASTSASTTTSVSGLSVEVRYLRSAQNTDGGFGAAPGQPSSELYTAWAAMGLAAAGVNPQAVTRDGNSVLSALRSQAGQLDGAGDLERTILALHAAGAPVGAFAGTDPVSELLALRSPDGSFGEQSNTTAFAIFALLAAGDPKSSSAVRSAGRWLAEQQNRDGGFSFAARGDSSDVDDTAAALQGLLDSGAGSARAAARAVGYLVRAQNADGGFPLDVGAESDAQSTAWVVQAMVAARRDPNAVRVHGGRSPLGYLQTLLAPGGNVQYSRTSDQTPVWVTSQALTALARTPFPIAPPGHAR
jgi:energy-coupling factor transport system substrate-specific component